MHRHAIRAIPYLFGREQTLSLLGNARASPAIIEGPSLYSPLRASAPADSPPGDADGRSPVRRFQSEVSFRPSGRSTDFFWRDACIGTGSRSTRRCQGVGRQPGGHALRRNDKKMQAEPVGAGITTSTSTAGSPRRRRRRSAPFRSHPQSGRRDFRISARSAVP